MSTISLRLPDSLHEMLRDLARKENISINQLATLALAEKVSALATEQYLEARAKRGDRGKFDRAMAKVADIKAEERDRLTSMRTPPVKRANLPR
ncbi:MAG: toxin-antitoxin system HicB family antitoxin [Chloroflexi bacterium]|nr:toxin-antitoxin system HicB family antitoxin [Chloroflexota bacterium]